LLALTALGEVRPHEQEPRQLSLGAGGRLERDGVETGHLREDLLQPPHQLECALGAVLLLQRVEAREARERGEALVDPRVVFHRARAERIEAGIYAEVPGRDLGEVADQLELRYLGQARWLAAAELLGELGRGRQVVVVRQGRRTATGLRLLVDQLHSA